MSANRYAERLDELIARGEELKKSCKTFIKEKNLFDTLEDLTPSYLDLPEREKLDQWKLSCLNLIENITDKKSVFRLNFPCSYIDYSEDNFSQSISHYLSVLKALQEELKCGYLQGVESIVTRNTLSSIIDEAKILLKAKYKDASAIYCRVILETAVKKYCDKNKITFHKNDKLSSLLDKLKAKDFFSIPEWRQVQAWIDIGNAAAHGDFSQYSESDVQSMLNGIEAFIDSKLQ
jgi:hypothetical protein